MSATDLKSFLATAEELLENARRSWEKSWRPSDGPYVPSLCHYSTLQGFGGIASTKSIWLTDATFLNDESELRYGSQLVETVLEDNRKKYKADPIMSRIIEKFLERPNLLATGAASAFVACFCQESDLLSQWRGYGASNGVSIGINYKIVGLVDELVNPRIRSLRKVIYDASQQYQHVEELLQLFAQTLNSHMSEYLDIVTSSNTNELMTDYLLAIFDSYLTEFIVICKDPSFSEENEWRISYIGSPEVNKLENVEFRASEGLLIPYVEHRFDEMIRYNDACITINIFNVVVGPTQFPEMAEKSARWIMKKNGYEPSVRRSKIPLRG